MTGSSMLLQGSAGSRSGRSRRTDRSAVALILAGTGAAAVLAARIHYAARPEDIPNPYASTHLTIAVTSLTVGAAVAWRRPRHPVGWVLLVAGCLGAWMYAAQPLAVELYLAGAPPWIQRFLVYLIVWPWIAARSALLIVAPSVVPAGWPRGIRRWILVAGIVDTIVVSVAQIVIFSGGSLDDDAPLPTGQPYDTAAEIAHRGTQAQWLLGVAAVLGLLMATLASRDVVVRRQTRWFVLAAAALATPGLGVMAASLWPDGPWPSDIWERNASGLLPLALGAAVVFDHFLDIRVVVRRAVLFGGLVGFGAAVFSSLTAIGSVTLDASGAIGRTVGAGVTAAALIPAWTWWRDWVDRHVYGDTSRPDRVLTRLSGHLAEVKGSHDAVRAIVETLAVGLKLPHVAVELHLGGDVPPVVEASWGDPTGHSERFPIRYAGDHLGEFVIGQRSPGERLRDTDRQLLGDLAGHVGVVLHDAHLEAQLRASREQIVRAREEERRRLRADLHDGLGPTLASVAMGLDAAQVAVLDERLSRLLGELGTDLRGAMSDIRRLVYGLRPPSLDELGLVRAIEQHARSVESRGDGLRVSVHAVGVNAIPAAVEVAAYRIALEAITNVHRHAGASNCETLLTVENGSLVVEIRDDGGGLAPKAAGGVGLQSMRERADELRGSVSVSSDASGTVVRAALPLVEPAAA